MREKMRNIARKSKIQTLWLSSQPRPKKKSIIPIFRDDSKQKMICTIDNEVIFSDIIKHVF